MNKFLIYKASAGSGKTYTLVKEYLKIVLNNPNDFKHILAITFTNKAADEMKNRIIKSLSELSNGENPELKKELVNEGVQADIKQSSKIVLKNILHKYYYFSILTIDSFFQRVIRAFSKELKLYIGYSLELKNNEVIEKITDDVLDEIGSNEELTRFLEDFAFQNIDESKGWKIDYRIYDIGMEIFKERFWELKSKFTEDIPDKSKIQLIIDVMRKIVFDFEEQMLNISNEAKGILKENKLYIEDFLHGANGVIGYLINNIGEKKKYEPKARPLNALNDRTAWYTKASLKKKVIQKALDEGLFGLLSEAINLWNSDGKNYHTAKVLLKTIHVIGIFKDLIRKLSIYRDENKIMLISDANNILKEITSDMAGAPFVFEKIGNNYKYFLIDEFQDTSGFQWYNLVPLIENSLSEGNLSLVVGDVKQAIYRWRNGDMRLLLEKIYKDLELFKNITEDRTLLNNRRSRKNIVEFNNTLFAQAPAFIQNNIIKKESDILNKAYADCLQIPDENKRGGYIYIENIPYEDDTEPKPYESCLEKVVGIVNDLKSEKIPLKDVLILTRTNEEGSDIAKKLTENNIPVVSADSLYLFNSACVKLLINILKYIVNNKNILAKTEVLYNYSLIFNGSRDFDKIFSSSIRNNGNLFGDVLPKEFFGVDAEGKADTGKINPKLYNLSLYELVESLVRIFSLSGKADAYLLRFFEIIYEYSNKYTGDIASFITWWEENCYEYSIIIPEEAEAVRIMTIHKAKGLQSPIVIVPFLKWLIDIDSFNPSRIWVSTDKKPFDQNPFLVPVTGSLTNTYFNKEYLEEKEFTCLDNINLLYVAFTRPVERLYAIISENANRNYTAGRMVQQMISENNDLNKYFNNKTGAFEIGEKINYQKDSKRDVEIIGLKKFVSESLYNRIIIRKKHDSLKMVRDKDFSDKTNWGILVHKALSYIDSPADINDAVERMIQEGLLTIHDKQNLEKKLKDIFSLDIIKSWFDEEYKVMSEKNIIEPNGDVIRPDRVLIKDNEVILIDYKTGKEKPEHVKQMNKYADDLKKMKYRDVQKYIFYIEELRVKEI